MNLFNFLKYNPQKRMTIYAYLLSAKYRFLIKFVKPKKLQKRWGEEGVESPEDEVPWKYRYAQNVSRVVDRICSKTAWESKCLVRALTAQQILRMKGIQSTLYLGCGYDEGKMVAHAWLRVGKMFVAGGDGDGYSVVDKFCA